MHIFIVSHTNFLKLDWPRMVFIQMRLELIVNSSVFRDVTQCSLVDAYRRFMLPPSPAQTKFLRLLWWSRIKDSYVLCGTLGYEWVFKEPLLELSWARSVSFKPSNANSELSSPLHLILRATFPLKCFSKQKMSVYVLSMFMVDAIFLGHRFFFFLIGLAAIEDVQW